VFIVKFSFPEGYVLLLACAFVDAGWVMCSPNLDSPSCDDNVRPRSRESEENIEMDFGCFARRDVRTDALFLMYGVEDRDSLKMCKRTELQWPAAPDTKLLKCAAVVTKNL
jgi:hypothetical protein